MLYSVYTEYAITQKGTTMFNTTQIWQHVKSGEWFLVRVDREGCVVYTSGALSREDAEYCVNEAGGYFDGTDEHNDWFNSNTFYIVEL